RNALALDRHGRCGQLGVALRGPWHRRRALRMLDLGAGPFDTGHAGTLAPRIGHAALTWISVTGRVESAPNSSVDAPRPLAISSAARPAIIAPLSVHRLSGGMRTVTPAAAARSSATSRRRRLAITPPPSSRRGTPRSAHAASALVTSTSTTAS